MVGAQLPGMRGTCSSLGEGKGEILVVRECTWASETGVQAEGHAGGDKVERQAGAWPGDLECRAKG